MKIGSGVGSPQPARSAKKRGVNSVFDRRTKALVCVGIVVPQGPLRGVGAGVVRRKPRRSGPRPRGPWPWAKCDEAAALRRQIGRGGERLHRRAVIVAETVAPSGSRATTTPRRLPDRGRGRVARRRPPRRRGRGCEGPRPAPASRCGWSGIVGEDGGRRLGRAGVVAELGKQRRLGHAPSVVARVVRAAGGSNVAIAWAGLPTRCSTSA